MSKPYVIREGEVLNQIAQNNGFLDGGEAILSANPGLRGITAGNGNVLPPGMKILIPDMSRTDVSRATGKTHPFKIPIKKQNLCLTLLDDTGKPLASSWEYSVSVPPDGTEQAGSVSDGSILIHDIPIGTEKLTLQLMDSALFGIWKFPPETIELRIGYLDPIAEGLAGRKAIQKILSNQGYLQRSIDGNLESEETIAALIGFQRDNQLEETGLADTATCDLLIQATGNSMGPAAAQSGRKPADIKLAPYAQAAESIEDVTTFSEYEEPADNYPADPESPRPERKPFQRFQFFPAQAYVAPSRPGEESFNKNTIRMPRRRFLFLDAGNFYSGHRTFAIIWGFHAYICRYDAAGTLGSEAPSSSRLDDLFLGAMKGKVMVEKYAAANWAPPTDFDWNRLYLIIPDMHLMSGPNAATWHGHEAQGYDLSCELDFLDLADTLIQMSHTSEFSRLRDALKIVHLGDSYDLWVACDPELFTTNDKLKVQLKDKIDNTPPIPILCAWIWDIQGRLTPWVKASLDANKTHPLLVSEGGREGLLQRLQTQPIDYGTLPADIEQYVPVLKDYVDSFVTPEEEGRTKYIQQIPAPAQVWWNPAVFALQKLSSEFGGINYIHGNHDNYLILPEVCSAAGIEPRSPCLNDYPGIFIEHGHRLESTFFGPSGAAQGVLEGAGHVLKGVGEVVAGAAALALGAVIGVVAAVVDAAAAAIEGENVGVAIGNDFAGATKPGRDLLQTGVTDIVGGGGTTVGAVPHNYDGDPSGHAITMGQYKSQKGAGHPLTDINAFKSASSDVWAKEHDQPQYWGEFAQIWLGRQASGRFKPPHIMVIGHTHIPNLLDIHIRPWRMNKS